MSRNLNADVEFTEQHPLLVNVGKIGKKWDIQPSKDKFPLDGKSYSEKMKERVNALPEFHAALKTNWKNRRIKAGPTQPEFIRNPDHIPIVVRQGEYVRFLSDYPFLAWAHRELSVTPNLDSPDSPFGWTRPQPSTQQSPYVVIGVVAAGLVPQRFYKAVAWIKANGQTILVDPDMIGT